MADTKEKRAAWKPQGMKDGEYWWRVCSPYVTVKTQTTEGMRIIGLHNGGVLPLDVREDALEHLATHNLIEPFPMAKAERAQVAADPPGGGGVPEPAPEDASGGEEGGQAPTQAASQQAASTSAHRAGGTSRARAADK